MADTFGTGADQFTTGCVPISYTADPASGYSIVNIACLRVYGR
jgi:hypothetical protein